MTRSKRRSAEPSECGLCQKIELYFARMTHDELKSALSYDAKTGIFTWKENRGFNKTLGKQAGGLCNNYLSIRFDGRAHWAHRLAWFYVYGQMPLGCIDHINGVKTDNRILNLRDASAQMNTQNIKRSIRPNMPLGVFFNARKVSRAYSASIRIDGRSKHLGYFDTAELAHDAYIEAKRINHVGNTL